MSIAIYGDFNAYIEAKLLLWFNGSVFNCLILSPIFILLIDDQKEYR